MSTRDPRREVEFQKRVLDAINTLLEVTRVRESAALEPLTIYAQEIRAEFARDEEAAVRYRQLSLPSGPLGDLCGVQSHLLGRALRAAMEAEGKPDA